MREQDGPSIADPLMEINLTLRRVGGKIRRLVVNA
jgi:hypothetical protein